MAARHSTGRGGGAQQEHFCNRFFRGSAFLFMSLCIFSAWMRWNMVVFNETGIMQRMLLFFFDGSGRLSWSNIISKDQYDDDVDIL